MRSPSSRRLGLCVAAAALCAGAARAQDYPSDLARTNPAAFAAWVAAVPAPYRKIAWIARFEGVVVPMERVTLDGEPAYAGWVCKPHDCGGNKVAFIIARDASSVSGLVVADAASPARMSWGAQSPERLRLLERLARD